MAEALRARGLKRCPVCGEDKPIDTGFYRPEGPYCKVCDVAAAVTRQQRDRDKYQARHKRWRDANPDKARRAGRVAASRRRALIREAFVEDIDPLVVRERDEGVCGLCGKPVEREFDVDHIVPLAVGGEHSYQNVRLAHVRCNRSRGRDVALAERSS